MTLLLSVLTAFSSQTLFFLWVSLELNIVSVLPLLNSKNSFFSSEIALKYFISQRIASIFFILSALGGLFAAPTMVTTLAVAAIIFKLGIPPFHRWLVRILLIRPYKILFLILIVQKFIPLHIFSTLTVNTTLFIWPAIFTLSLIFLNLKNISNLRISLILSAWGNTLWLILAAINSSSWATFLLIYGGLLLILTLALEGSNSQKFSSFLKLSYSYKIIILLNFLSLAGLPPFRGFFIKIFLLTPLINFAPTLLILGLLLTSLAVLFAYLIISYYILSSPFQPESSLQIKPPVRLYLFSLLS